MADNSAFGGNVPKARGGPLTPKRSFAFATPPGRLTRPERGACSCSEGGTPSRNAACGGPRGRPRPWSVLSFTGFLGGGGGVEDTSAVEPWIPGGRDFKQLQMARGWRELTAVSAPERP